MSLNNPDALVLMSDGMRAPLLGAWAVSQFKNPVGLVVDDGSVTVSNAVSIGQVVGLTTVLTRPFHYKYESSVQIDIGSRGCLPIFHAANLITCAFDVAASLDIRHVVYGASNHTANPAESNIMNALGDLISGHIHLFMNGGTRMDLNWRQNSYMTFHTPLESFDYVDVVRFSLTTGKAIEAMIHTNTWNEIDKKRHLRAKAFLDFGIADPEIIQRYIDQEISYLPITENYTKFKDQQPKSLDMDVVMDEIQRQGKINVKNV